MGTLEAGVTQENSPVFPSIPPSTFLVLEAQRVHHFFGAAERGTTWRHHGAIGCLNLRPMLDRLSPLLLRRHSRYKAL